VPHSSKWPRLDSAACNAQTRRVRRTRAAPGAARPPHLPVVSEKISLTRRKTNWIDPSGRGVGMWEIQFGSVSSNRGR